MLTSRLWAPFAQKGQKEFLVMPNKTISYAEARRAIGRWISAFDNAGLQIGDRVIIRTDRADVAATGFLAALLDGIVPVMLESSCPEQRMRGIIDSAEPRLVFSDGQLPDLGPKISRRILTPEGKRHPLAFLRPKDASAFCLTDPVAERTPRLPHEDGLAYLMFTSGTTSEPAGVAIHRGNLAANLDTITQLFDYGSHARIFNDMILAHADGMIQGPVLAAWNHAAVLRAGGFEIARIEKWLGQIRQMHATHVITVPTVWAMIDMYALYDDYFDAPECQWLMSVADKISEQAMRQIEKRFSRPLASHYGLTETVASALYSGSNHNLGRIGTLGHPVDCAARIAGGTNEGELQLKGANVFKGYWRNPERTAQSFTDDGWFRTGDLARRLEDGSYEMLGRLKTVIMSGGFLIRPDEIDEAMARHPSVIESVTVALDDDIFGEIPVTAVTLASPTLETELIAHLRGLIEPRKVSKRIIDLPEIPRGLSGKPVLSDLRKRLAIEIENTHTTQQAASQITPLHSEQADRVLQVAAEIFHVSVDTLSPASVPDDVTGWDSFTHLNLIFGIEAQFGIRLSTAQVSAIRSLGDLIHAVAETK